MNQSEAIDTFWKNRFFEEKRSPKEVSQKMWDLHKINCSNISMILKQKKYLRNDNGWIQRYGYENSKDNVVSNKKENLLNIVYIESGKPVTAQKDIAMILSTLKGEILICDPFLGVKTFVTLYNIKNAKSIKFICGTLTDDQKSLKKLINDYNKENDNLEIKIFDKTEIHDRYIITDNLFIILGHGLSALGNKESLVIILPRDLVEDVVLDIKNRFLQKWNGSKNI